MDGVLEPYGVRLPELLAPMQLYAAARNLEQAPDDDSAEILVRDTQRCIAGLEKLAALQFELSLRTDESEQRTNELRVRLDMVDGSIRVFSDDDMYGVIVSGVRIVAPELLARLDAARGGAVAKLKQLRLALLYCLDEDDEELDALLAAPHAGGPQAFVREPSVACDLD